MPTCAICLQPIANGSKFLLADTEVMHRSCALAGGQTAAAKLRQELAELRVTAERNARIAAGASERCRQLLAELRETQRRLAKSAHEHVDDQILRVAAYRDIAAVAVRERDAAIAERDAARSQPPIQAPPAARAPEITPITPIAVAEESADDAAVRFSLLEFDAV